MDEQTQLKIIAQMEKLPADVRQAILSVDLEHKLQEISRRQHLLVDQAGALEIETTLVMIGLEPLSDYTFNLQKNLNVSIVRAKEISFDVSENIFKPIRESLQQMNSGEMPKKEEVIDREQILNEIENPVSIKKIPTERKEAATTVTTTTIEKIEDNKYQKDFVSQNPSTKSDFDHTIGTKMAGITITQQKVIDNTPVTKLPAVEKSKPTDGIDPYRELI